MVASKNKIIFQVVRHESCVFDFNLAVAINQNHVDHIEYIEKQCFDFPWTKRQIIDEMKCSFAFLVYKDEVYFSCPSNGILQNHRSKIVQSSKYSQYDDFDNCSEHAVLTRDFFSGCDGYGFFRIFFGQSLGEINKIAVSPEKQKQGIATNILQAMEQLLQIWEFPGKIELEVAEKNVPAINFYKKNGFLFTAKRKNYYKNGDHALIMEKQFS